MQRRAFLEETLSYLLKTDYPHERLEVFVVDGGSTDGSESVVRACDESSDIAFRWHSDPALRVAAARNHAIENSTAEVLVFLDDDCITEPGWIHALVAGLREGEADIAGGTDVAPPDEPFLARCEDVAFRSLIGSGGVRGGTAVSLTDFCPMTCNMAMRREKLRALGAFDGSMREVEDTELVYRAKAAGLRVRYVPEATVQHRRRASLRLICIHNYVRGVGRSYLRRKYPGERQAAFFVPGAALMLGVLLACIGFVVPVAWWVMLAGVLVYGLLLTLTAVQGLGTVRRPAALFVVPTLVALHHFCYGIGTLIGPITGYRRIMAASTVGLRGLFGAHRR